VRFIGLVLAMTGVAVGYLLGYRGLSVSEARDRLAQLLNLPGLKAPTYPAVVAAPNLGSDIGNVIGAGARQSAANASNAARNTR
jgi:hypothetical protein